MTIVPGEVPFPELEANDAGYLAFDYSENEDFMNYVNKPIEQWAELPVVPQNLNHNLQSIISIIQQKPLVSIMGLDLFRFFRQEEGQQQIVGEKQPEGKEIV